MATSTFAAPLGVPIFRWFDANGNPLASGQVETYVAGTSTPLATYPTYTDALAGTNANANPVILDGNGAAQIWVQAALYKIIVKASVVSGGATLYTQDNVSVAFGSPFPVPTEWVPYTGATSFVSATVFTITGVDATGTFHVGRRIRSQNSGGTVYSTIRSSAFAVDTTVTVVNDGASVLDAGFTSLNYGMTSFVNDSYLDPRSFFTAIKNGNQTAFAASTKIATWTSQVDSLSEWDNGNNRWVCKYPGKYLVTLTCEHSNTVANINAVAQISLSGAVVAQATGRAFSTATNVTSLCAQYAWVATVGQYIEGFFLGDANTTVVGSAGTRLTVSRVP